MTKLILLNGTPGIGKTTLAKRYIDEHPMALSLDIDVVWIMMGQWQESRPQSNVQKLKLAYAMADVHLGEGYDVIVPNLIQSSDQYEEFERIAIANNAALKEVVLLAPIDEAIERLKVRGRAQGYKTGWRPGGVMDTGGREKLLHEMHDTMLATIATQPNIVRIQSVDGDINGTYSKLIAAVS